MYSDPLRPTLIEQPRDVSPTAETAPMRFEPIRLARIDHARTLVDPENAMACSVVLQLAPVPDKEWRDLFDLGSKVGHEWLGTDHLRIECYRVAATDMIGQVLLVVGSVNGTIRGGHRPAIEAQQQLDEMMAEYAQEKGIAWGEDAENSL